MAQAPYRPPPPTPRPAEPSRAAEPRPAPPPTHEPPRPATREEPPRHPAQPPPARPGVPQRDLQPQPDDPNAKPPPEERAVAPEEALQLFRAGHRLKKRGDPPDKWFAAFRLHNTLVICYPVDEEIEKHVLDQDLVLADEPPAP
jgi:hypothetical protein